MPTLMTDIGTLRLRAAVAQLWRFGRQRQMKRPTTGMATNGAHPSRERSKRFQAVDLLSGDGFFTKVAGNATNNIGKCSGIYCENIYAESFVLNIGNT